jgi:hypothetical protein
VEVRYEAHSKISVFSSEKKVKHVYLAHMMGTFSSIKLGFVISLSWLMIDFDDKERH